MGLVNTHPLLIWKTSVCSHLQDFPRRRRGHPSPECPFCVPTIPTASLSTRGIVLTDSPSASIEPISRKSKYIVYHIYFFHFSRQYRVNITILLPKNRHIFQFYLEKAGIKLDIKEAKGDVDQKYCGYLTVGVIVMYIKAWV